MSIVESDGPPSWYLVMRAKLGKKTMLVGKGGGVKSVRVMGPAVPSTTPTHGHFVLSKVSLASRDQDGGPSDSTIDIYDLTEK